MWYVNSDNFVFFIRPYTFFIIRNYAQRKLVLWVEHASLILTYTWHYIAFIPITEYLHGFRWVCHFTFRPLYVPSHNVPIGIYILKLVRVSCVVVCASNHDGLVRLVLHLFLIFPFFVTYMIHPNYENKPRILFFLHRKFQTGSFYCLYFTYFFVQDCKCELIVPTEFSKLCHSILRLKSWLMLLL